VIQLWALRSDVGSSPLPQPGERVADRLFEGEWAVLHVKCWAGPVSRLVYGGAPGAGHRATRALVLFRSESDIVSR